MGVTTGPGGCGIRGGGRPWVLAPGLRDAYRLDGRAAGSAGDSVVRAVGDVNLHLDEAAFAVVLGPSGSGKTTLLNLVGALDAPTAGTIRLGWPGPDHRIAPGADADPPSHGELHLPGLQLPLTATTGC